MSFLLPSRLVAPGGALPVVLATGQAVHLRGANDAGAPTALYRSSPLAGASDSAEGIFSLWFDMESTTPVFNYLAMLTTCSAINGDSRPDWNYSANDILAGGGAEINFSAGSNAVDAYKGISPVAGQHHALISWDLAHASGSRLVDVAIDGTYLGSTTFGTDSGGSSLVVPWSTHYPALFCLGWNGSSMHGGTSNHGFDVAEFYLETATYLPLSVPANIKKFRDSVTGKPVELGADGSTPTGTAATIFLKVDSGGIAADFLTNRGTGGDFTNFNALTIASTTPY